MSWQSMIQLIAVHALRACSITIIADHSLWYCYLVDAKVAEVERYIKDKDIDITTAIADVLEIRV